MKSTLPLTSVFVSTVLFLIQLKGTITIQRNLYILSDAYKGFVGWFQTQNMDNAVLVVLCVMSTNCHGEREHGRGTAPYNCFWASAGSRVPILAFPISKMFHHSLLVWLLWEQSFSFDQASTDRHTGLLRRYLYFVFFKTKQQPLGSRFHFRENSTLQSLHATQTLSKTVTLLGLAAFCSQR